MNYIAHCVVLISLMTISLGIQSQEAHIHGEAQATLVFEEGILQITIESPVANLLGFEHQPNTEEQVKRYRELLKTLNSPESMVGLKPKCTILEKNVVAPFSEKSEKQSQASHDMHKRDHHEHEDHDSLAEKCDHQDFNLTYRWQCAETKKIDVTFGAFDLYESLEKLSVQWLAFGRQGAEVLTAKRATIRLTTSP